MQRRMWLMVGVCTLAIAPVRAEEFPTPYDTEQDAVAVPLSAEEAAQGFQLPEGFRVDVFAAEPEVRNPIAMAWDARGRMWVAENYTYAEHGVRFAEDLRDRVVIFEDADGDGRADGRTVFTDEVVHLTGLAVGRGGVYLMCPPRLLFVPDRDGDDRPDAEPQVVLEGFTVPPENHHNFANGLRWGPDGWLYGRCGASAPGAVHAPHEPESAAIPLAGGIWRYDPRTRVFEPLSHGTTNPWGHDWNADGEGVFINTVNGHLWHLIPGAHYERSHTLAPNRLVYEPMAMHADHWHWDTQQHWTDSRGATGAHDLAGGGHAHSGALIYQGAQWPAAFEGRLLTLNLHGRRVNVERLERSGSGIVARHEPDILHAADPFFRGLELSCGPDGSVYVLDWSDTGECHEHTGVHRNSGRIYRVSYDAGGAKAKVAGKAVGSDAWEDLRKHGMDQRPADGLLDLHRHPNTWFVRAARRELADRAARDGAADSLLREIDRRLAASSEVRQRLRLLWTRHALALADPSVSVPHDRYLALLEDSDERIRVWAIRLLVDRWPLDTPEGTPRAEDVVVPEPVYAALLERARSDSSGLVRLALASALQRLPLARRPELALALAGRGEDAGDANLPKLIWYGMTPLAQTAPAGIAAVAAEGRLPLVRRFAARCLVEIAHRDPQPLEDLLAATIDASAGIQSDIILGMVDGVAGQRQVEPPPSWEKFAAATASRGKLPGEVESALRNLQVVFGDGRALEEVRRLALDDSADLEQRRAALETLIEVDAPEAKAVSQQLLGVRFLNTTALRGLARFADPEIGRRLAASYRSFPPAERSQVIETLASRPSFAAALLEQIAAGKIDPADVSAGAARQIRSLDVPQLSEQLTRLWGEVRTSPAERQAEIDRLKTSLTDERLAAADLERGRALFDKACRSCHRLVGSGGTTGPDLTGADRRNLDYVLSNVIDPSAVVTRDYQITIVMMEDGRVLTGIAIDETDRALSLQTTTERVVVPKAEIEMRRRAPQSLMPDGLLQTMDDDQVRDLVGYLMSR